jgi:copper chaperone CopZ
MKTILITFTILFAGTLSYGQNKNAKASIKVDGVCMMCKKRIEKASIKTKGVKSAVWNVDTHELRLIFDENKTSIGQIESNVTAVGHDTKSFVASKEAYGSLYPCCKYRDESVIQDHK